jgi:uncharacterized membrane protein YgcG
MKRKIFPTLTFMILSISWVSAGLQDCSALVEDALSRARNACAVMRGNQACYGNQQLEARLIPGLTEFAFNGVGDITPVDTIQSLNLSPLNPTTSEWGVSMMRIRADISEDYPNENVSLLVFGAVSLMPDQSDTYQPMQAFTFSADDAQSGCTNMTESGLLIQTPEGVGEVTLWMNEVRIRIGSTVLFEAAPDGDLTVSTYEGKAIVEAMGETQEAVAGMRVRVPMNSNLQPAAPPTEPEPFDTEAVDITPLINTVTAFTNGSVRDLIPLTTNNSNGTNNGSPGNTSNSPTATGVTNSGNDCNQDNGQGDPNGNCFGQNNPPGNNGGNGNSGGNGNAGGNGSGNNGGGNNGGSASDQSNTSTDLPPPTLLPTNLPPPTPIPPTDAPPAPTAVPATDAPPPTPEPTPEPTSESDGHCHWFLGFCYWHEGSHGAS